jgi:hypothetical protein
MMKSVQNGVGHYLARLVETMPPALQRHGAIPERSRQTGAHWAIAVDATLLSGGLIWKSER